MFRWQGMVGAWVVLALLVVGRADALSPTRGEAPPTPSVTALGDTLPSATPSPTPLPAGLRLNELLLQPASDWNGDGAIDGRDRYVELRYQGVAPFDLSGWWLVDGAGSVLKRLQGQLQTGDHHLLFLDDGAPLPGDPHSFEIELLTADGREWDGVVVRSTVADQPWSRDEAGGWHADWPASPGTPNVPPTATPLPSATASSAPSTATPLPTPTPAVALPSSSPLPTPTPPASPIATASPSASATATLTRTATTSPTPRATPTTTATVTATPQGTLRLNEFLPRPVSDWNNDGTISTNDEYIELRNRSAMPFDLTGWQLDDIEGGSSPYTLTGTLAPDEIRVIFRSESGVSLNDSGDTVRLLTPNGEVWDEESYASAGPDQAWSRDEAGGWHEDWPPSPGAPNAPPPTPTASPSPTPIPLGLRLNEFLPRPVSDWNNDGTISTNDEYIELRNRSAMPFDLTGWQLDDIEGGSSPYTLTGTLAPDEIRVIFRSESGVSLNDSGDTVRLLTPNGEVWDEESYASAGPDQAWSRDEGGGWHDDWPPSPGTPNAPLPTPTPTAIPTATATTTVTPSPTPIPLGLRLNEFLPRPVSDWNNDGTISTDDEYIELRNRSAMPFDLTGWQLDDIEGGSSPYTLTGTLAPDEIRVIFRSESGVALNDSAGDTVRLLTPNGEVWDEESYAAAGPDQAWSRDEAGGWHDDWPPSPGTPNAPPPTPTPTPTPGALQPILISEVLYDGAISGQGDEFVELWNGTGEAVALDGWLIGDEESQGGNEGMYRFPDTTTLGAGEALIVARDAAAFHQRFGTWPDFAFRTSPDPALVPLLDRDTTWASGHWALDDNGDEVLLLDRWQRFVDGLAFRNGDFAAVGLTGHDINASEPRALHHVVGLDSPHVNDWVAKDLPTPRQPYAIPSSAAAPLGPALDGLPVAWGSLHSHSFYSDGSGPPALAFGVARANGMNFMAVSDHSHWFVADEWQTLRQAATAANRPGEFLALAAFEWTHREQGHANVFHTSDYVSRDEAAGATLADFYGWLAARPDARATFNHPFAGQFNNLAYVPSLHPHFVGMEVGNGSGSQQTRYENSYWQALRNGWRIGAMGNLDTETPNWGDDGQLRTGVLLPALGQGDLWAAIEARRTFATEDRNLALAMRAGDVWMGGAMAAGTQRIALWFRDGDGEPMQLQLLRDGVIVAEQSVNAAPAPQRVEVTVDALSGDIFVARAVQSDGQMAWSSPLWVTGTATPQPPQLSEVLSAPRDVDWDGNGIADFNDEWIELHNPHDRAIALGGYRIEVEGFGYTVPAGRTLEAHGYALFFKAETGISLSNYGELVRLVAANGGVVDEVDVPFQGYDLSKARCGDGWQERVVPTPGGPCQPAAGGGGGSAPPPAPQPIAVVRELPEESLATIEGIVTAPPSVFGAKSLYLQDESGGIKLYRYAGLPDLAEGERIRVTGYVKSHFGEIELTVPSSRPVERLGSGEPLLPIALAAGTLGQHAGQLVAVSGTVERWSGAHWRLDDGVESIFIYHDQETGVERPYLNIGETRTVIGIVGWSDYGPRLMPRYERDISDRELITLPIKAARALEAGQPVRVMGVVTAPTGLFDEKVAYLQDDSGGIKLYGTALPDLALGERLIVTGTVRVAFGEVELSVAGAEEIHSSGGGEPPVPNAIDAGTLADHLGELVEVSGTVEGWRGGHWYLNDGVESIFIYHDPESGVERPYLTRGEHRTVVGIVGASEKGPRLMPRFDSDLSAVGRSAAPRMSIANARAQPLDSRIEIEGVVVAAPGRFALTIAYIQDESGGIKLYRSAGFPAWVEGDRVRVVGYLKRSFGELELSLPQSSEVVRIGGGTPPAPRILGPGELSAHAGELVQVQGRVEGWRGAHWYLFDGRESLFIYHDRDTGVTRPYLTRNDIRTVVGIVGWSEAGPRLMPRYASDVGARGRYQSGGGGGTRPSDLPTTGRP